MNVKVGSNSNSAVELLKGLAPYLILLLSVWFWMGGAEAKQTTSTKQLDRIELKMAEVETSLTNMKVTVEGLRKDIEYLKGNSSITRKFNQSEFNADKKP